MRYLAIATATALAIGCGHKSGATQAETKPEPKPAAPLPAPDAPDQFNKVSTDEQARSGARTLDQILAGRLSGVNVQSAPGGGIIVRFSSAASFQSGEEPLFIIDGAPVVAERGTLTWLNPHDVESITALKGAEAAIYGVRGANGVIVIKTKGAH